MRQRAVWGVALLAIALAAGCAKRPDDAALVTNIKAQMFSDSQLKDASLQVTSKNGQVTLSGTVPNDAARYEAYKLATQTPGVSKVIDQMTAQEAQSEAAQTPKAKEATAVAPTPAPSHRMRRPKAEPESQVIESADNDAAPEPPQDQPPVDQPNPAPFQEAAAPPPLPATPPPPQPQQVEIPASTTVTIRMIDSVDSSVNHPGEIFHASLEAPIVEGNQVVVPKGADIYVRLANASSAGRISGRSELHLELIKLEFQGQSYPLVSSTYSLTGSSRGKSTGEKVGGGAVLGALIGAIAGGGRGAAIGAGVGAGAGGVYQGSTKGKQVKIPSETKLDFHLEQPVTVTVIPRIASPQ
ncbi:MAG TPA: BON domain-containing protein [Candidatus Acidoferrales bacterium]|nr:BON domain-containing protein [Candidatus Acidoferrales bacterium]